MRLSDRKQIHSFSLSKSAMRDLKRMAKFFGKKRSPIIERAIGELFKSVAPLVEKGNQ